MKRPRWQRARCGPLLASAGRGSLPVSLGAALAGRQLLRVEVHPDPAARHDAPAYAVEEDPAACLEDVSDDADVHWEPDGRLGVACEAVGGRTRWYRLVERPSPAHGPRYVNALSLCQRRPAAPAPPPKRARPAPLLPLSPKLKRARSLASVESFHDLDAAHALAELVSA